MRRLKREVMAQLPAKRRQVVRLPRPSPQDWPTLGAHLDCPAPLPCLLARTHACTPAHTHARTHKFGQARTHSSRLSALQLSTESALLLELQAPSIEMGTLIICAVLASQVTKMVRMPTALQ